jgi:hypothetical protein
VEIEMKVDGFMRVVLVIIAVLLLINFFRPTLKLSTVPRVMANKQIIGSGLEKGYFVTANEQGDTVYLWQLYATSQWDVIEGTSLQRYSIRFIKKLNAKK